VMVITFLLLYIRFHVALDSSESDSDSDFDFEHAYSRSGSNSMFQSVLLTKEKMTEMADSNLVVVKSDYLIPEKAIRKTLIHKKCSTPGLESKRWITLGYTQILISRDKLVRKLVNIIPLQGGFVSLARKNGSILILRCGDKSFSLRFNSAEECEEWYLDISNILKGVYLRRFTGKIFSLLPTELGDFNGKMKVIDHIDREIQDLKTKLEKLYQKRRVVELEIHERLHEDFEKRLEEGILRGEKAPENIEDEHDDLDSPIVRNIQRQSRGLKSLMETMFRAE